MRPGQVLIDDRLDRAVSHELSLPQPEAPRAELAQEFMSWETRITACERPSSLKMRSLALSWNAASPTPSASSMIRISGSISVAMANASLMYMPLE